VNGLFGISESEHEIGLDSNWIPFTDLISDPTFLPNLLEPPIHTQFTFVARVMSMSVGTARQHYTVEDGSGQIELTVWGEGEAPADVAWVFGASVRVQPNLDLETDLFGLARARTSA
jgi:hypothetical protein